MSNAPEIQTAVEEPLCEENSESGTLQVITWLSVGVAVAAVSLFVGRELRSRYKFNRRTPYDFYDHAFGNDTQTSECGLGV